MKVLVIGSGGREHALGWKLKASPLVSQLYFAPGNGGTSSLGQNINISVTNIKKLADFAQEKAIDLTIVGPEIPLEKGIVDKFTKRNLKIFGPTKKAARLETSKVWAAKFMKRHHIPQPDFKVFTNPQKAKAFISNCPWKKVVIKADGLAAGKGVILPGTIKAAYQAISDILIKKKFGAAGNRIVIQEKNYGPEVSIFIITDGKTIVQLKPAQDHKRALDGDKGLNTGGMGAYVPAPFATPSFLRQIQDRILEPAINGMKQEGCSYQGILYAGIMVTQTGPVVIEFNARLGDPEAQPLLMLLKSDLTKLVLACTAKKLTPNLVRFQNQAAACVVLAAYGYPKKYPQGMPIMGLNKVNNKNVQVFHAGTTVKNNRILSSGGRVLNVTATGPTVKQALSLAYSHIGKQAVHFKNMHYRKDIGRQAL